MLKSSCHLTYVTRAIRNPHIGTQCTSASGLYPRAMIAYMASVENSMAFTTLSRTST